MIDWKKLLSHSDHQSFPPSDILPFWFWRWRIRSLLGQFVSHFSSYTYRSCTGGLSDALPHASVDIVLRSTSAWWRHGPFGILACWISSLWGGGLRMWGGRLPLPWNSRSIALCIGIDWLQRCSSSARQGCWGWRGIDWALDSMNSVGWSSIALPNRLIAVLFPDWWKKKYLEPVSPYSNQYRTAHVRPGR